MKSTSREEHALKLLYYSETYPGMVKREISERKLLIWRNNTLGDYITWALFDNIKNYLVRRVIWKQHSFYKLNDPETYCSDALASAKSINHIMDSFLSTKLFDLVETKRSINIDGSYCGIIFQNQKIEWASESGKDLLAVSKWCENTIFEFEDLFP